MNTVKALKKAFFENIIFVLHKYQEEYKTRNKVNVKRKQHYKFTYSHDVPEDTHIRGRGNHINTKVLYIL